MQIHPRLYEKMNEDSEETIPVILYSRRSTSDVRDCIIQYYGKIKYDLPFIQAVAVELPKEKIHLISKNQMVQFITEDAAVQKADFPSVNRRRPSSEKMSALSRQFQEDPESMDQYFHQQGRQPITVASVDTGVSLHQDLLSPINLIRGFQDFLHHREAPYDDDGHGTHVAGILCGLSERKRKPGPGLVAIKALDENGNGSTSDILASLQWILNNQKYYNIRVVNLSLGVLPDDSGTPANDPLIRGANMLVRCGISVVAAAGNSGPKPRTINSPATSPYVITVGAAGGSSVASFSSRGPTKEGLLKPDLVAPGVDIISLDAKSRLGYAVQSGTSMAAPVISRAAARLYAAMPELDPLSVKRILLRSTVTLPGEPASAQGFGLFLD